MPAEQYVEFATIKAHFVQMDARYVEFIKRLTDDISIFDLLIDDATSPVAVETLRNHKDHANQMLEQFQRTRQHIIQPTLGLIVGHDDYPRPKFYGKLLVLYENLTEDNVLYEEDYALYREETFVLLE